MHVFGDILPLPWKRGATGEGGLITGTNPAAFTTTDPLRLWIIQLTVIVLMAQLLSLGLRRLRQPKVIAEVLGGILLGPTAFGRIPGFTDTVFPAVSLPYLSLVANIGLCLFLFIVGLEIDVGVIKRNARMSTIVSLAGIALPFGLGALLSIPLYHHFIGPSVHFTYFMLFTGVAYSITAFPVLCRILTELKLLDTQVGIIVLSAGVGNDIIGWTLLALSVALVNAGSGLTALWILLACIAFTIFLLTVVTRVMHWLARKTGSIARGPTMSYMTVVMLLVWASGFFTDAIGVNAIFGAFLAGLTVPREGGLAITLTEKLEDMVTIVFLPLYFTLSGLNTNLGLLNDGITWAFTIAIIVLSFSGKFGGCTIAARVAGYGWREAGTVGALMSCKGLVELIVLNVGLQAGILSPRVFSMFVLEALTLTFLTTPLVMALYPPARRREVAAPDEEGEEDKAWVLHDDEPWRHRFTVVLDTLEHIPSAMALTQLFIPAPSDARSTSGSSSTMDDSDDADVRKPPPPPSPPPVHVDALQLVALTDRTSAMMKSVADVSDDPTDPTLALVRLFGALHGLAVSTAVSVVAQDAFAARVAAHAQQHRSHLVLLAYTPPHHPHPATAEQQQQHSSPLGALFDSSSGGALSSSPSPSSSQWVREVCAQQRTADVAVLVDTGCAARLGGAVHVFLPFLGGRHDRLALALVVQLCAHPRVRATVVRFVVGVEATIARPEAVHLDSNNYDRDRDNDHNDHDHDRTAPPESARLTMMTTASMQTTARLQSDTADALAWARYASARGGIGIAFSEVRTSTPVHAAVTHARALSVSTDVGAGLLVVAGRARRDKQEMARWAETVGASSGLEGMRRTIGDVGTAMAVAVGSSASVMVVQAAREEV